MCYMERLRKRLKERDILDVDDGAHDSQNYIYHHYNGISLTPHINDFKA